MQKATLFIIKCITSFYFVGNTYAQEYVMLPWQGSGGVITLCQGTIIDNGGHSEYLNNSNGFITIAPDNAQQVTLFFESFSLEPFFDYVKVYDGTSLASPLIGTFSGTELSGQSLTSTGPYLTIQFVSDNEIAYQGFVASWGCLLSNDQLDAINYSIYPNPTTKFVNIYLPYGSYISKGYVTDFWGNLHLSFNSHCIDLESIASGIYLIQFTTTNDDKIYRATIIKVP